MQDAKYFFLSSLLKVRARYEGEPRPFGRLYDLGAGRGLPYAPVVSAEIRAWGGGRQVVPWADVVSLTEREMVVRKGTGGAPEADFWLRRDVLDDQVVDVSGAKVWRVNDVHLLYIQEHLIVGHAEVGILGILRRLGFERPVCWLAEWLFDYKIEDKFVTWRHVEVLSPGPSAGGLRVRADLKRLEDVHPAELAEIMEQLGARERQQFINDLPIGTAAEALEASGREIQRMVVTRANPEKMADILGEMAPEEAARVLRDLGAADAESIIARMTTDAARDVRSVLSQAQRTAGAVMTTSCIQVTPEDTAGAVVERVRQRAGEMEVVGQVFVLDDERRAVGVLSLRELLAAPADTTVGTLMTKHLVAVGPETRVRDVAKLFAKYGFRSIPVVDEKGLFLGAVRLKNVLEEVSPLFRD